MRSARELADDPSMSLEEAITQRGLDVVSELRRMAERQFQLRDQQWALDDAMRDRRSRAWRRGKEFEVDGDTLRRAADQLEAIVRGADATDTEET